MEISSSLSPIPVHSRTHRGSTESCTAPALEQQEGGRTRRFSRSTKTYTDDQLSCASQQESDLCFDQSNRKPQRSGPRTPSRSIQAQIQSSRGPSLSSSSSTIPTPGVLCWQSRDPPAASSRQNPSICPGAEDAMMTLQQWMSCGELKYPAQGHWSSWRAGVWRLSSHQPIAVALKPLTPSCHTAGPRGTAEPCKAESTASPRKCAQGPYKPNPSVLPCPGQAPQGDSN